MNEQSGISSDESYAQDWVVEFEVINEAAESASHDAVPAADQWHLQENVEEVAGLENSGVNLVSNGSLPEEQQLQQQEQYPKAWHFGVSDGSDDPLNFLLSEDDSGVRAFGISGSCIQPTEPPESFSFNVEQKQAVETFLSGEAILQTPGNHVILGCRNFAPSPANHKFDHLLQQYWLDVRAVEGALESRKRKTADVIEIIHRHGDHFCFWDAHDGPRDDNGKLCSLSATTWQAFCFRRLESDKELKAKLRFPLETSLNRLTGRTHHQHSSSGASSVLAEQGMAGISRPLMNLSIHAEREPSDAAEEAVPASTRKRSIPKKSHLQKEASWKSTLPSSNIHEIDSESEEPGVSEPLYGRYKEMKDLKEKVSPDGKLVSLVGRSGVGKTHLARVFAWEWTKERDKNCTRFGFWLNAATESTLRESYETAIRRLRHGTSLEEPSAKRRMVTIQSLALRLWETLAQLSLSFEWILVFDNVPAFVEALDGTKREGPLGFQEWFLPRDWRNGRGRILLLSTHDGYVGTTKSSMGYIAQIRVDLLDEESAVQMLQADLPEEQGSEASLHRLVSLFDCLPLAIATAKGELLNDVISVDQYIKRNNFDAVQNRVQAAIRSSLNNAYQRGLGKVLDVAAYVNPDSIPLILLGGESANRAAIQLTKWNILRRDWKTDSNEEVYSMHRLHQNAARQVSLENGCSPGAALRVVHENITTFDRDTPAHWKLPAAMVKHVVALKERVESWPSELCFVWAQTLQKTAEVNRWVNHDFGGAKKMSHSCISVCSSILKSECLLAEVREAVSEEMVKVHMFLGKLHRSCSQPDDAKESFDRARNLLRLCPASDARSWLEADILDDIGRLEHNKSCYAQALEHFRKALEIRYRAIPDSTRGELVGSPFYSNDETYSTRLVEQEALRDLGRNLLKSLLESADTDVSLPKPQPVEREYSAQRKVLGALADTLVNFGRSYREGEDCEGVQTWTKENYGRSYGENGYLEEALFWFEAALGAQSLQFRNEIQNDSVATTISHLGRVHIAKGNFATGLEMFQKSLAMKQHVYGKEKGNESIATAWGNVATAKRLMGECLVSEHRFEAAFQCYTEAFENYKRALGMLKSLFNDSNHKKVRETCAGIISVANSVSLLTDLLIAMNDPDATLEINCRGLVECCSNSISDQQFEQ